VIAHHHNAEHDFRDGLYAIVTGSGAALPDPWRGNANAAVVVDGHLIQFDCGRGTMDGLLRVGINPLDVDYLFFTHLHFDHIATYGYFVISSWIGGRQTPLEVYGPIGTKSMTEHMLRAQVVDVNFVGHLLDTWPDSTPERPVREAPVRVTEFAERGLVLETPAFTISAVETPHYREFGVISYGYRVDCAHGSIVISGDGRPSQGMVELARDADLVVHECTKPDPGMIRTGKFAQTDEGYDLGGESEWTGGHTTPRWLGELAHAAGVKKVVATHLPPYDAVPAAAEMCRIYTGGETLGPQIWTAFVESIKRTYDGEVVIAEDGMVFRVTGGAAEPTRASGGTATTSA
jgi:ribonuclease Z